jgi:hypothetical protein
MFDLSPPLEQPHLKDNKPTGTKIYPWTEVMLKDFYPWDGLTKENTNRWDVHWLDMEDDFNGHFPLYTIEPERLCPVLTQKTSKLPRRVVLTDFGAGNVVDLLFERI